MDTKKIAVVGGGVGGLACAALLAQAGHAVDVFEAQDAVGGKLRQVQVGARLFDAGPTVLTMRWVFEALFAQLGARFDDHVGLAPAQVLARHFWPDGSRLDLLADAGATSEAIAAFAGPSEAERYRRFCTRAAGVYEALEPTFLHAQRPPTPLHLAARFGWRGLPRLARISPFDTLWGALGACFRDPRLQQLFGRYATYCGSSPFLSPATLMLVAWVEQRGVWLVQGDMARVAQAIAEQAVRHGAQLRLCAPVREIDVHAGTVRGVVLESGETVPADAVVFNGDVSALHAGLLGAGVARAGAPAPRSLSAVTWSLEADAGTMPLQRHNVFFAADSRREFADLFERGMPPAQPTLYVCAQDRGEGDARVHPKRERLFCLANAPAGWRDDAAALARLEEAAERLVHDAGLVVSLRGAGVVRCTPERFGALYPGTGGALYGAASHGWRASFRRAGARTRVRGLYCAGGSAHPGPGVPMAVLSGRLAAAALLEDVQR